MHPRKFGFFLAAIIFVAASIFTVADAYQTVAHRYITCKALKGLRKASREAHKELRQYANCHDCAVFKNDDCLGLTLQPPATSQALIHAIRTPEWLETEFCAGLGGPTYQSPGAIEIAELEVSYEGDDLVTGSSVEDSLNETDPRSGLFSPAFASHFWDPDQYFSATPGDFDGGLPVAVRPITRLLFCDSGISKKCHVRQSSYHRAKPLWERAISLYREGNVREAYYTLGRVAHLLEDLTVPAHVHGDNHNGRRTSQPFLHTCCGGKRHGDSRPDTLETYTADKAVLQLMDGAKFKPYKDEKLLDQAVWESLDADEKGRLFKLFWFTAQKTQYWASNGDQNPGGPDPSEVQCSEEIPDTSTICDEYAFGELGKPNIYFDKDGNTGFLPLDLWSADTPPLTLPCRINTSLPGEQEQMAVALLSHALQATSSLYRLFWDVTHDGDGDGYGVITDCDDADPLRFPGNAEVCADTLDNDCNEIVNDGCPAFSIFHTSPSHEHPHFFADIRLASAERLSTSTTITVQPGNGFTGEVVLSLTDIFRDDLPVHADGTYGDGVPDDLSSRVPFSLLVSNFDGFNGRSKSLSAGSSTVFLAIRLDTPRGRYMLRFVGRAGDFTAEDFVLFVVGEETPGYNPP